MDKKERASQPLDCRGIRPDSKEGKLTLSENATQLANPLPVGYFKPGWPASAILTGFLECCLKAKVSHDDCSEVNTMFDAENNVIRIVVSLKKKS